MVVVEGGGECFVVVRMVLLLYAFAWGGGEAVGMVEALVGSGQFGEGDEGRRVDFLGVSEVK